LGLPNVFKSDDQPDLRIGLRHAYLLELCISGRRL
jgi:hypothetical protein